MVAEGGDLVVVDTELVGHVDAEPLGAHLQGWQNTGSRPSSCAAWSANHWTFYRTFQKAWSLQVAGPSLALKTALRKEVKKASLLPRAFAPDAFNLFAAALLDSESHFFWKPDHKSI